MTPFEFHTGFDLKEKFTGKGEKIWEMNCPFCADEGGHFHFFETTQFGCKKCGVSGNNYDFIKLIYEQAIVDLGQLPKQRSLPERALAGIKFNRLTQTFVLPTYKIGKLNNLYKTGEGLRWMGTPGLPTTLYNWDEFSEQEVWMCEGQWDRCAAIAIIGQNNPVTPIGIPGATSFKEAWCGAFKDKDVVLIFDNDDAGAKGIEKAISIFNESAIKPKSLKFVGWPENAPKGYDLRDYYIEHGRASYRELKELMHVVDAPQAVRISSPANILEDYTCDTYDKALDHFETAFHTTTDMRAALAACMASIYSIKIPGEQLWFKLIASAGSGKTRIAKALSASEHVVARSTFTGLFSGWVDNSDDDPGLIPIIAGKTLFVKDADALMKQAGIEKIMSELRDFYDKDTSVQYRTRKHYEYHDVKSTIIICGTQVLRRADQSYLGERFLTIEMDMTEADEEAIKRKMMERSLEVAMGIKKDPEVAIQSAMKGWINHMLDRKLESSITKDFQKDLIEMCSLTALMRTQVDRDFKRKLISPAMPELPTRLIGQMVTATLALSVVFGQNKPDNSVFAIIQKILRDTINPRSHRFKICQALAANPDMDAFDLMSCLEEQYDLHISRTVLQEELDDLNELKFIKVSAKVSDLPGRRRYAFRLDDRISVPLRELI